MRKVLYYLAIVAVFVITWLASTLVVTLFTSKPSSFVFYCIAAFVIGTTAIVKPWLRQWIVKDNMVEEKNGKSK